MILVSCFRVVYNQRYSCSKTVQVCGEILLAKVYHFRPLLCVIKLDGWHNDCTSIHYHHVIQYHVHALLLALDEMHLFHMLLLFLKLHLCLEPAAMIYINLMILIYQSMLQH